ncbi:trehalose synthase (ADP-glucose) [Methanothrix thermoacetophila PT]|uniref:Trehalose synthase (ADP-glucose) n=2 Tax=Methanothrix TaxID=2222 RepID=A0B7B2_METTP|nr:trehalose synthase (ADP-glucose) [Methanothrix thermoacetophila PT]
MKSVSMIDKYRDIVGDEEVDELYLLANKLEGKSVQHINSTAVGGGVAEILSHIVPLMKELGVEARWDVIKGDERFFSITKSIHNALHGSDVQISEEDLKYFLEINRWNAQELDLSGDILFIHDPQPIPLIEQSDSRGERWIWRCHIDLSRPAERIMDFLRGFIEQYDVSVFSAPSFARKDLTIEQVLISPSIDPLSSKNMELPEETINSVLERYGIDRERPVVTQVSRFDRLKDPFGVIEVYRKVKEHIDCQLVLAGGGAADDPEGPAILEQIRAAAETDPDIHVIYNPPDIEINALQRGSTVILQKSLGEGFGLTVTEALWKGKPVIASAVGGIPLQIRHRQTGILTHSIEGTVHYLRILLNQPRYASKLGECGREHVRNNFLITRHIKDYLGLFIHLYHRDDIVYL